MAFNFLTLLLRAYHGVTASLENQNTSEQQTILISATEIAPVSNSCSIGLQVQHILPAELTVQTSENIHFRIGTFICTNSLCGTILRTGSYVVTRTVLCSAPKAMCDSTQSTQLTCLFLGPAKSKPESAAVSNNCFTRF